MTESTYSEETSAEQTYWTLRMLQGPQAGARLTLHAGTYWLGSDPTRCDVALVLPRSVPVGLFGSLEVTPEGLHLVICTDTPRLVLLDSQSGARRVLRNGEGVHISLDHQLLVEDESAADSMAAPQASGLGSSSLTALATLQLSPKQPSQDKAAEADTSAAESNPPMLMDMGADQTTPAAEDVQDVIVKSSSVATGAVDATVKKESTTLQAPTGPWWLSNSRRAAKVRAVVGLFVLFLLVIYSFQSKWLNQILPAGPNPPQATPSPLPTPSPPKPNPALQWKRSLPAWAQELSVVTVSPATGQYPPMYAVTGTVESNAQLETLINRLAKAGPEVRLHVLSLETFAAQLAAGGDITASAVRQRRSGVFELTLDAPAYRKSRTRLRRAIEQEPQVESLVVHVLMTPVPYGVKPETQQVTLSRNAQSGDVVVTGETPVLTEPDVKTLVDIVYIRPGPVPSVRLGTGDIVFEGASVGKGLTLHTIEANRVLVRQAATGRLVEIFPPQRPASLNEESDSPGRRFKLKKKQ